MRYFFDWEFLENSAIREPIHPLSLGMVRDDGRELYLVNRECPVWKANDWVKANVLPKVDLKTGVSLAEMRRRVLEFVGPDPDPVFVGYVSAYDWCCLAGLIGRMVDLPKNWPKFAIDIKQQVVLLGGVTLPPKPDDAHAHNALCDARWTRDAWQAVSRVWNARVRTEPAV